MEYRDKYNLDKHLKTSFHCSLAPFSNLKGPLDELAIKMEATKINTDKILDGMQGLTKVNTRNMVA